MSGAALRGERSPLPPGQCERRSCRTSINFSLLPTRSLRSPSGCSRTDSPPLELLPGTGVNQLQHASKLGLARSGFRATHSRRVGPYIEPHPGCRAPCQLSKGEGSTTLESEILNVLDDHSRFLVGSKVRAVLKAADVVTTFYGAAASCGFPASLLTDNASVFSAAPHGGRSRSRQSRRLAFPRIWE